MNVSIQTLKAEIAADIQSIQRIFAAIHRYDPGPSGEEQGILVAYHLHNLYSAFESIFRRIAATFENQLGDQGGWHAELLRRMSLEIEGIRPNVIGTDSTAHLDELRRFRHLFRSAYRLQLDPERLALAHAKAMLLETSWLQDLEAFLRFLESLN